MARLVELERHPHYKEVAEIMQTLNRANFEALLAGGCVRDALLGNPAKDLDVATSARPNDVERLFEKTIAVGRDFGTMVVVGKQANYEVTTFRKDGPYLDGRHPASVEFTDAEEDAKRRDFTINALFYDPNHHDIIDYVSGQKDIHAKLIRAVGHSSDRFEEDHLRLLRAVRFVAQLGFEIESSTWSAICALSSKIKSVSVERIWQETIKLLGGPHMTLGLTRLVDSGLAAHVLPSLTHVPSLAEFLKRVNGVREPAVTLALIGLAHDSVVTDLEKLRAPKHFVQKVRKLIRAHGVLWNSSSHAERVKLWAEPEWFEVLTMAEIEASRRPDGEQELRERIAEFLQVADVKGDLPKPFLTGDDLLKIGFAAGPALGRALDEMYRDQLEGRISSKNEAEKLVRSFLR